MVRGIAVLGAVLLLSSCTPSSPDLAAPTPPASSMASTLETEDSEATDEVGEEADPGEDIYPDDFWDWMVEPIGLEWGWTEGEQWAAWEEYTDGLQAGTAPFQGPLMTLGYTEDGGVPMALAFYTSPYEDWVFHSLESHCALAREFMWVTQRGPRSMEADDLYTFYLAQKNYLIWMTQTANPMFVDPESGWPQGVDSNMVFQNTKAYLHYMIEMVDPLMNSGWDVANTPQIGGHAAGAHIEGPASAVADFLRDHLTNNCGLDLAAQANSWADEEYHQCARLAFQIIAYANSRVMSYEPIVREMSHDSAAFFGGQWEASWEEHAHPQTGIPPGPTTENLELSLASIKALYENLRSGFIHVEPSGATEDDVCLTTGNWPPMFTLFLEST